jgi:hypothetical protein
MTKLTDQQKIDVVNAYVSGFSSQKIAIQYNISSVAIRGILKRRNIPIRSKYECNKTYHFNEHFFDTIDSQEKAYFLGFLYADGCNSASRNNIKCTLSEKDKDILLKFSTLLGSKKPLRYIISQNPKWSNYVELSLYSKHLSQRLQELGCFQNKTYIITFPDWLATELYPHFIRGYYDGDGCLVHTKTTGNGCFSIVGTENFCLSLQEIFKSFTQVTSYITTRHPEHHNNIRTFCISGNLQILKVLNWLYQNSTIYLERKYQKFIDFKLTIEAKHRSKPKQYCLIESCHKIQHAKGFCKNHYYQFCNGSQKRHLRYVLTKK